jgi:hypothetical protein
MAYNPEKYREKREKVLGIKKRGIEFSTLAVIISFVIIAGLAAATAPQVITYISSRYLDDAIFRPDKGRLISDELISEIESLKGVRAVNQDIGSSRLIITFDRRATKGAELAAFFERNNQHMTLLNEVPHDHKRIMTKKGEEY